MSGAGNRRRLTEVAPLQRQFKTKRPVNKSIVSVRKAAQPGDTTGQTVILAASSPCTVTGFRWEINACNSSTVLQQDIAWALVIVKAGNTPNAFGTSDGANLYTPEQNVIAWGATTLAQPLPAADAYYISEKGYMGETKTQRKLMAGDSVYMLVRNAGAGGFCDWTGCVQLVCRF